MSMTTLKEKFLAQAPAIREQFNELRTKHSNLVVAEYNIGQVLGGMRGIAGLMYETSALDSEEGIRFRGYTIPELQDKLPKAVGGGTEPLPEGIFYLMLTGQLPTEEDVRMVTKEWADRADVPAQVFKTLDSLPQDMHPMTQFSIAVMAAGADSVFAKAYRDGVGKDKLWEYMFEDVMTLIGRLPHIAAYIYRRSYKGGEHIAPNKNTDWAANFAHMLGFEQPEFCELLRLHQTIHVDHEGGNVSAHTTRLVGSALSDAYLSFSAALNGLAGPLHGLANQEVIRWILEMREEIGEHPNAEGIEAYIRKTLAEGRVIPGYGHAVLRKTDPRFMAQRVFAQKYMPEDELVGIVSQLFEIVPRVLGEFGKIKNPFPNVDAHSGALLLHYGLKEYDFYTVLFGVSRSLGVLASLIWDRYLGLPLERPKSVTMDFLLKKAAGQAVVLED